ncbi:hypothetical protein E8M01_11300 [Phreatobacter stygius]|uniref:UPF0235 protein E8M01_11300 n=1 Tax=Phreatobacter stygius TaxID=1940610 RepID=A0A4D7B9H1_9HYPH|nr:hypothetical protein E8M01_11300 [Phreatobacter stygius]
MTAAPYRLANDTLLLDVRLTPRGGRDALEGTDRLADGRAVVKARVRAVPEDGKANAALEQLVADRLGVARSQVSVVQGKTARLKTVAVHGDPVSLSAAAARLFAAAALAVAALGISTPAAAQFVTRGDICASPTEFVRTRVMVERAGLSGPDKSRLVRTLRSAQSLAEEGCPNRDGWLIRRAVGMLNAVNREVRNPPVDLPLFLRD